MNIDAHGFEINISAREYDINNNDIYVENGIGIHNIFWPRGGTGVVYNNSVSHEGSGFWNYFAGMSETRISANRGNKARPELYGGIPASSCCATRKGATNRNKPKSDTGTRSSILLGEYVFKSGERNEYSCGG
jgi:hypothetical protein